MNSNPLPSLRLVADTLRAHRRGILAWVLGGGVAMVAIGAGFRSEVARFNGGARGMADSMQPGVQAMRLLRWPADRLDTLGGYLTYHNITLLVLFLTLYGAVQGVGAVRGAEAGRSVEMLLATGLSRARLQAGRALGFAAVLAVIGLGLGLGFVAAGAAGGEPDIGGAMLTGLSCAACAFAGYGIGALAGQLGPAARSSSAVAALLVVAAYLYTNVWDRFGPLTVLRYVSPFYYFDRLRALVPGAGFDVLSFAGLLAVAVLLSAAAAWLFEYRDIGSSLGFRRAHANGQPVRVQRPVLARLWSAILVRERTGLAVWSMATAAGVGLMAWLEPEVADMWDKFDITRRMLQISPGFTAADQYFGFVSEFVSPIVAAFVITQAAGWVGDHEHGRTALLLSTPLSQAALVRHRLLALMTGVASMIAAAAAGMAVTATIIGAHVSATGILRAALTMLLFAAGLAAVAAAAVTWFPRYATTALTIVFGASYLLVLLVPMFAWPSWLTRISVFGAIGHPYLQNPPAGGIAFLAFLTVTGYLLAVTTAARVAIPA